MGRPVRTGTEIPTSAEIESFWQRVDKSGDCWLWTSYIGPDGYGKANVGGHTMNSSRAAWLIAVGPIPDGLYILHRCDVRACVRPEHLYPGTQKQNVSDMDQRGRRGRGWQLPYRPRKISDEQVAAILALRKAGYTQRRVAALFGISHTHVGKLETGRLGVAARLSLPE